jgi:hypothetical protein
MRLALGCLLLALPALAQLDSASLRAKFGAPLTRETYRLQQGFDLTVDYNAANQVCKLAVPAEMQLQPNASGPFNPRKQMQDFLGDLVPDSMRGKDIRRFAGMTGASSAVSSTEYEHVTISQSHSGRNDTIAVIFHNGGCR